MIGETGPRGSVFFVWGVQKGSVVPFGSPPSALPGISPTRREISKARTPTSISRLEMAEGPPRVDLPTCGGDARQGRGG